METDVIPPGTYVNVYAAYNIMLRIKDKADILQTLHELEFASIDTIPLLSPVNFVYNLE